MYADQSDIGFRHILPLFLSLLDDGVAAVRHAAASATNTVLKLVCPEARKGFLPLNDTIKSTSDAGDNNKPGSGHKQKKKGASPQLSANDNNSSTKQSTTSSTNAAGTQSSKMSRSSSNSSAGLSPPGPGMTSPGALSPGQPKKSPNKKNKSKDSGSNINRSRSPDVNRGGTTTTTKIGPGSPQTTGANGVGGAAALGKLGPNYTEGGSSSSSSYPTAGTNTTTTTTTTATAAAGSSPSINQQHQQQQQTTGGSSGNKNNMNGSSPDITTTTNNNMGGIAGSSSNSIATGMSSSSNSIVSCDSSPGLPSSRISILYPSPNRNNQQGGNAGKNGQQQQKGGNSQQQQHINSINSLQQQQQQQHQAQHYCYSLRTKRIVNHLRRKFRAGHFQSRISYIKLVNALIRDSTVSRRFVHLFLQNLPELALDRVKNVRLVWAQLIGPHLKKGIGKCTYHRKLLSAGLHLQQTGISAAIASGAGSMVGPAAADLEIRRYLNYPLQDLESLASSIY